MRVELDNADVVRGGELVLGGVDFCLDAGQGWLLAGPSGSGKTTLLKLLRGDLWPAQGRGRRVFVTEDGARTSPIGFRERTALVSPELSDRLARLSGALTVADVLAAGAQNALRPVRPPGADLAAGIRATAREFEVLQWLERPLASLSQGQRALVMVARAMVAAPRILFLDEFCDGLDAGARERVLGAVARAMAQGTGVVQVAHRRASLVPGLSCGAVLRNGRIAHQGRLDEACLQLAFGAGPAVPAGSVPVPDAPGQSLFLARGASVVLDGRLVLDNIDWEVRAGEHWAVTGGNGAGKTTLMRLMLGEVYPLAGGEVVRFGDPNENNVWRARRRMGFVSAALQERHQAPFTVFEAVASGLFGHVGLHRDPGEAGRERVARTMALARIEGLGARRVDSLSRGQLRRVLAARAVVGGPDLVLLDEPCGGLDKSARQEMAAVMAGLARTGATLVIASHHETDIADFVIREFVLPSGHILRRR